MSNSPWPDAPKLYAYFDETRFDNGHVFGYGMLLTNQPIGESIITEALARLREDPEFDRQTKSVQKSDRATLARGAFHASEDSKNGHSFLCEAITSSVQGEFFYATTRDDQPSEVIDYPKTPGAEDYFNMMLTDNFIRAIVRARHVDIVVEERCSLTEERIAAHFERIVAHMERRVVDLTFLPFFAPNVTFRKSRKNEPGLQVVDFILWALNRRAVGKECPWAGRLNLVFSQRIGGTRSPEKSAVWILRRPATYVRTIYPQKAFPIPDLENHHAPWGAEGIRRVLLTLASSPFPSHAMHLRGPLDALIPALRRRETPEAVRGAASLFLRLFDTLPIYHDIADDQEGAWKELLLLRRIASRFLGGQISGSKGDAEPKATKNSPVDLTVEINVFPSIEQDDE